MGWDSFKLWAYSPKVNKWDWRENRGILAANARVCRIRDFTTKARRHEEEQFGGAWPSGRLELAILLASKCRKGEAFGASAPALSKPDSRMLRPYQAVESAIPYMRSEASDGTANMKVTISLPADVSERVQKLADVLGISTDQFLALIISRYVNDRPGAMVTETLYEVYETEPSALDPVLARLQSLSIAPEEW